MEIETASVGVKGISFNLSVLTSQQYITIIEREYGTPYIYLCVVAPRVQNNS